MARLAIDVDFMDDFSKLPKPVQASVKTAIEKFAEHIYAGIHLEKVQQSKDDRIRTIRIDRKRENAIASSTEGGVSSPVNSQVHPLPPRGGTLVLWLLPHMQLRSTGSWTCFRLGRSKRCMCSFAGCCRREVRFLSRSRARARWRSGVRRPMLR